MVWHDFQIMVLEGGQIWHLDLDRFFRPATEDPAEDAKEGRHVLVPGEVVYRPHLSDEYQRDCLDMLNVVEHVLYEVHAP
jgi:hypothetical protein